MAHSQQQCDSETFDLYKSLIGKWIGCDGTQYELDTYNPVKGINVWTKYADGRTRYTVNLIRLDDHGSHSTCRIVWGKQFWLDESLFEPGLRFCVAVVWRRHIGSNRVFRWRRNTSLIKTLGACEQKPTDHWQKWDETEGLVACESKPTPTDLCEKWDETEASTSWEERYETERYVSWGKKRTDHWEKWDETEASTAWEKREEWYVNEASSAWENTAVIKPWEPWLRGTDGDVDQIETLDVWESVQLRTGRKSEPRILYESSEAQVLNKGPFWLCSWNSHGSKSYQHPRPRGLNKDTRSWQEIVSSNTSEFLDMYVARKFTDEMAFKWWDAQSEYEEAAASGAGFVHRLDIETSGCILRAKNWRSFEYLKNQLRRGWAKKVYTCLVHGAIRHDRVHVVINKLSYDAYTGRTSVDDDAGVYAETRVRCRKHFLGKGDRRYSLCDVQIVTGRTHQIRVHLKLKGFPLVRDSKYNPMFSREDSEWCPRIFLHAHRLRFWDGNREVCAEAPLPLDLQNALESLRLQSDFGNDPIDDFETDMLSDIAPAKSAPSPIEPELVMLAQGLRTDIMIAVETSGGTASLSTLVKNMNIRYKLRALQCGGADADGFMDRLKAFIRDRIVYLNLNEEDMTVSYRPGIEIISV